MKSESFPIRKRLDANETTFGATVYSGSCLAVEAMGHWGLDFAFIDAEHTAFSVSGDIEKMIMSAKLTGISPMIRVPSVNEVDVRKVFEMGAEGVIVPQVKTADEMRTIVRAAKFPPIGRRGGDASVRSARWAGPGFNWPEYTEAANASTLVIPMAENFEFFDNLDEILEVDGIDIVNYGPVDYALSKHLPVDYSMSGKEIDQLLDLLIAKCHARGIKVMAPCIPTSLENAQRLIEKGVDMLIMGNDMMYINNGCRQAREGVIDHVRATAPLARAS
ncbi:HpcH/HpaI aldolase family protein [Microvirga pudoricolor]|uniref:HpcH/HpaI aldolase family protein n=1 Tax=Microvirga pudoricolor TaxID=2778729 RepID=UPI00195193DB|nr:aldolase/citrate lyase family protein [Microvirga pudoricolor]MBM6595107.1 hypothetical protein [Microvirga pudoricolor]